MFIKDNGEGRVITSIHSEGFASGDAEGKIRAWILSPEVVEI